MPEPLGFIHVVSRQDGRPARDREGCVITSQGVAGATGGRAPWSAHPEKQKFRVAHEGDGHGEPLLLAAGKLLSTYEFDLLSSELASTPRRGSGHPDRSCGRGGPSRGRSACRETAFPEASTPIRPRISAAWLDQHRRPRTSTSPEVGSFKPFQDLDRGRLARAIGTEEAEAFADGDFQVDPIDRINRSITPGVLLAEVSDPDGPIAHQPRTPLPDLSILDPASSAGANIF